MPRKAESDAEILSCFDVMSELRADMERDDFVGLIRAMQQDGYQLAYLEDGGEIVAVAGYRIYTNLGFGKNLYVDDLVTAAERRSEGFGERLLHWLRQQAEQAGCRYFRLDSATYRHQAHKFYFRHGMTIAAYHFIESMKA